MTNVKDKWKLYQNYIIILLLSIISVFFLPMLGSTADIGFNLPSTFAGWLIWVVTKLAITAINILLFDQFIKQGKVNILNDERYLKAEEILNGLNKYSEIYKHPKEYIQTMYKVKGRSLFISTILCVFGLTNAILTFDWVSMLTYLFTVIMGIIFGWMSMNEVEEIWTEKYLKYAYQQLEIYNKEHLEINNKEEKEIVDDNDNK